MNKPTMNELIEAHSLDKGTSENNRFTIMAIGEAIRQVVDENFPTLRYPVIAGGAIRDTIFGLPIKDFDIFFETSEFQDKEEIDDVALLLIAMICEKLAEHEWPRLRNVRFGPVGHVTEYAVGEGEERKVPFVVYENYPYEEEAQPWIPGQNDLLELADVPARDEGLYSFPLLQVIGHRDQRLLEDPVAFLEYFDYALVRGLYDPYNGQFKLHPTLPLCLESKEIEYSSDKTRNRLRNFLDKFHMMEGGRAVFDSFILIDTRPMPEVEKVIDVPFEAKTSTLSSWAEYFPVAKPVKYIRPHDPLPLW